MDVDPRADEAPAGHAVHTPDPAAIEYVPAGHTTHALAPASEYVPAIGHEMHTVEFVAPDTFEYVPAVQLLHCPLTQYLPVAHKSQLDDV